MELNLDDGDTLADMPVSAEADTDAVDSHVETRLNMKVESQQTLTEARAVSSEATSEPAEACCGGSAPSGECEVQPDLLQTAELTEERAAGKQTSVGQAQQDGPDWDSPSAQSTEASTAGGDGHHSKAEACVLKKSVVVQSQNKPSEEEEEEYQLNVFFEDGTRRKPDRREAASEQHWAQDRPSWVPELQLKREPDSHPSPPPLNSAPLPSEERSPFGSHNTRGARAAEKTAVSDIRSRLPQPFVVVSSAGALSSLVQSFAESGSALPPLLYNMSASTNIPSSSSSSSLSLMCTLANSPGAHMPQNMTNGVSSVLHGGDSGGLYPLPLSSQLQGSDPCAPASVSASGAFSLPQAFVGNTASLPALAHLLAEKFAPVLPSVTGSGKIDTTTVTTTASGPQSASDSVTALSPLSVTSTENGSRWSVLQQTPQTCQDTAASLSHMSVGMSDKSASNGTCNSDVQTTSVPSLNTCNTPLSSAPFMSVDRATSPQPQNSKNTKDAMSSPPSIIVYNVTPLLVLPQSLFSSVVSSSLAVNSNEEEEEDEEEEEADEDFRIEQSAKKLSCEKCSQTFKTQRGLKRHMQTHERESHICGECGDAFPRAAQLKKHKKTHAIKGKKTFECKVCHKTVPVQDRVKHARSHGKKPHACDVCNKKFSNAKHLVKHKKGHTKPKHVCDVCDMTFNSALALKKHSKTHSPPASSEAPQDTSCKQCGKKFLRGRGQQNHVCRDQKSQSTGSQALTCDRCGKTFKSRICLQIHVHSVHMDSAECLALDKNFYSGSNAEDKVLQPKRVKKSNLSVLPTPGEEAPTKCEQEPFMCTVCGKVLKTFYTLQVHERIHKKLFACKVCNKRFSHYYHMKRHQHVHTGVKDFTCEICQKTFISSHTLKLHYTGIHLNNKPFVCDVCNQGFVTRHSLKLHKLKHSDDKPFTCDFCGRSFKYECVLKSHRLLHLGEKPFKCDICDKAYVCSNYLTKHMSRAHSDPKYTCDVCGKTCYFANELKNHKLIHTEEKPFSCEICAKSFHTTLRLKNHQRIHSDEKPFTCKVCGKVFSCLGTMNNHIKRVHSGRVHTCEVCKKTFKTLETLKDHRNVHLQLKSFVCEVCGKDFYSNSSLKTHRKLKHTDMKMQFMCNVCGKSFAFPSYLREHEKTHSKEKTLVCELCNKAVKYKLDRHMKRVHNIIIPGKKNKRSVSGLTPVKEVEDLQVCNSVMETG